MDVVVVKKWGNSHGIRFPQYIMKQLDLHVSDELVIEVEDHTITMKKRFKHKTFEERLAEFDGNIEVEPFDWGEPKGRELI